MRREAWLWRRVHWPRPLDNDAVLGLLRRFATDPRRPAVAFEARAEGPRVRYLLGLPATAFGLADVVPQLVPDAVLSDEETDRAPMHVAGRLRLSSRMLALATKDPLDVTRTLLAGLTSARHSGESLVIQVVLGPRRAPQLLGTSALSDGSWWQVLLRGSRQQKAAGDERMALRTKTGQHGFAATIRIGVRAATTKRRHGLLMGVLAGMRTAEAGGVRIGLVREHPGRLDACRLPWRWPLRLNVSEVLALTGWPLGDDPLPGLPSRFPRLVRAEPSVSDHGRVVARATAPGDDRPLGLSAGDALQHLHVLGPTGAGKSTLLRGLITQDIVAGRGLVVIDPKGDLVTEVLRRVPEERQDDIVVLDPGDEAPVGFNPLVSAHRSPEVVADGVLAVFHALFADSWGPRTQDILHSCLLTLTRRDDASLVMLPLLLTNPGFRRSLTQRLDDPVALGPFWAWYEQLSDGERAQAIAPVMNKLRAFLLRRSMRAVLGQRQPQFDVAHVFTERKVLLVSLRKGLLGPESSGLLGSLVVARLWQTILARARVPAERRHPVMVYIDEVQDYLHLPTDLADALAQARGLGVGFTLAHQFLAQLPPAMRAAVMANARSRVCFQLGPDDAIAIAKGAAGLAAEDFMALGRYEVYASLFTDGQATGYASGRTLPPSEPCSDPEQLLRSSRERYGQPLDQTEAGFADLASSASDAAQDPLGRRRRQS